MCHVEGSSSNLNVRFQALGFGLVVVVVDAEVVEVLEDAVETVEAEVEGVEWAMRFGSERFAENRKCWLVGSSVDQPGI